MILQALRPGTAQQANMTNAQIVQYFNLNPNGHVDATDFTQHVRVMIRNTVAATRPNPTNFHSYRQVQELRLDIEAQQGVETVQANVSAYWLPWQMDTGYHVDLPNAAPASTLFVTPPLSGCYVGVQNMGGNTRVYHYNADPALTPDDLRRYGCNRWLAPNDENTHLYQGMNAIIYQHNTAIWGEYINGAWHFFYKASGDPAIHYMP